MMTEDTNTETEMMDSGQAKRLAEAIIFASTVPVTHEMLQEKLGAGVAEIMQELLADYAGRGVELKEIAGGWMFRTAPDLASELNITVKVRRKLPRVAAETLAIIAYHQPVTRAEIESIRGVATARETLDMLMELSWVRPGKRRETPGRPLTWATTEEFLKHFGLGSLKDLPGVTELRESGLLDARPVLASFDSGDAEAAADVEDEETLEFLPSSESMDEPESARTPTPTRHADSDDQQDAGEDAESEYAEDENDEFESDADDDDDDDDDDDFDGDEEDEKSAA